MLTTCAGGPIISITPTQDIVPNSPTIPALKIIETETAPPEKPKATLTHATPTLVNLPTNTPTLPPTEKVVTRETTPVVTEIAQTPKSHETRESFSTLTATLTPQPTLTLIPTATADLISVNGIAQENFIIMDENVRMHAREIFADGQLYGRNPNAFSKLGDSVTLTDHYLTRFDSGHYNLGPYSYLQPTIDHYSGSFSRYGVATRVGLHAWSIFDPLWANKDWCSPEEHMVSCEIRLYNPSVMLIKIGSNDNGAASAFDSNVRQLVEYLIANGIVPVLGTKADRFEGPDDRNNQMLRQIAKDYAIPLWDYDRVADTLPRRGLSGDNVHLTMADSDDYTDPKSFERGYPVSDLTALMMLHEILQEVDLTSDT